MRLFSAFSAYFESLISAFPNNHSSQLQPPASLWQFFRFYTKGTEAYLMLLAISTILLAIAEVSLYAILGQLVDWLSQQQPQGFFPREKIKLISFSVFVLIGLPLLVSVHSSLLHQTFMGNLAMRVRWLGHRYLLQQSWAFYQQEFSGRIATKLMQTSLAVRECVLKLTNVLLFICVYLIFTIVLVASLDWRLSLPLIAWILAYSLNLFFFLPRLQNIAMTQADTRSEMTGRIVDSYTNVQTLKMFSSPASDESYAKNSMQDFLTTVHPQMRLVTGLNISVWCINMLLVFFTAACGLWFWSQQSLSPAALAVAMSIAIRISGMSHWIMWEVSNLFEHLGTVKDGLNTLAKPTEVIDSADAKPLSISSADIHFQQLDFAYHAQAVIFNNFNLSINAGEKVGLIGPSGAGKSTLVNLLLRFYDINSGEISIDGQNISNARQDS